MLPRICPVIFCLSAFFLRCLQILIAYNQVRNMDVSSFGIIGEGRIMSPISPVRICFYILCKTTYVFLRVVVIENAC